MTQDPYAGHFVKHRNTNLRVQDWVKYTVLINSKENT